MDIRLRFRNRQGSFERRSDTGRQARTGMEDRVQACGAWYRQIRTTGARGVTRSDQRWERRGWAYTVEKSF